MAPDPTRAPGHSRRRIFREWRSAIPAGARAPRFHMGSRTPRARIEPKEILTRESESKPQAHSQCVLIRIASVVTILRLQQNFARDPKSGSGGNARDLPIVGARLAWPVRGKIFIPNLRPARGE